MCETKFWKSAGFLCKCWLSTWMRSDTTFCVQQNYFLLPLSNKSLFLCRCVLDFDLTAVGLCLISPGKELHSQLPSAANALSSTSDEHTFPVRPSLWTDILFLLDQPIIVQTSKPSCPSVWRGSNCVMVHGMWQWREEKEKWMQEPWGSPGSSSKFLLLQRPGMV